MRKVYSFLLLFTLFVTSALAQVTSLDGLSNTKAYTIASARCFFQNVPGTSALVTSTGSVTGIVAEASADSINQQYAILKGDANYYLYSVGAGMFINSDGSYAAAPTQDTPITVSESGDADYPFMLSYGSNYINTQESGSGYENGYVINSWNTKDEGNQFKIIEAAEPDLSAALAAIDNYEHNSITVTVRYSLQYNGIEEDSYETTTTGAAPLAITFDAPKSYLGATCVDVTRTSEEATETKTIDVVYSYTLDADALPFVPATITDGTFAQGTKWYYLKPEKATTYSYYDATLNQNNGGLTYTKSITSDPADTTYFFTFTGNPLSGFQIRNYTAGASKAAYSSSSSSPYNVYFNENSSNFYVETGTNDGQYRFHLAEYTDGLAYLDAYYSTQYLYAWSWSSGWAWYAANDGTAQYYIAEVSDQVLALATGGQMSITSITPEEGIVGGGFGEVNVIFDQPIYRIYSLDHEGYGMEGEEEAKVITLTASDGTVTEFTLDGDGNGYELNEDNPNELDIYLERPLTTSGKYTLNIPLGLVYSEAGTTNAERNVAYSVKDDFEPVTVTGRVYNAAFGDFSGTAWPAGYLPYDESFGYYTIQVQVNAKDEVVFKDYTGASGEDLKVEFSTADGSISLVDDTEADSYGSYWATSNVLDGYYSGYYLYYSPSYCNINFNTEDGVGHGTAALEGYEYSSWTPYYMYIEWYLDDRFAQNDQAIAVEGANPADGSTVESLQTISVIFDRELTEVANGKEITLKNDAKESCGGTITYALNADNAKQIDITLSETITANGTYTLTLPSGLGAREAETNAGYTVESTLTFVIGTGSSATWTAKAIDYIPEDCTNALFSEGGQFSNIVVNYYEGSHKYVVKNFMGAEGYDLTIITNENDSVLTINGSSEDSYGSMSVYTGNSSYYFAYLYPGNSTFNFDAATGYLQLQGYYYVDQNDGGSWHTYAISWNPEVVTGINGVIAPKAQNTSIYNLAGQYMGNGKLARGIYVKDGRKIVIK